MSGDVSLGIQSSFPTEKSHDDEIKVDALPLASVPLSEFTVNQSFRIKLIKRTNY